MSTEDPSRGGSTWPLFVARRFVRARRQGFVSLISLLSALGFTVGVASLVVVLALMTGFQDEVIGQVLGANAHVLVFSAEGNGEIDDPDGLVERILAVPGIVAAGPVVHGYAGLVAGGDRLEWTSVTGAEPKTLAAVTDLAKSMSAGSLAALGRPTASGRPGIVLGAVLARKLGTFPGDTIRMVVPRARLTPWGASLRRPAVEVVGTFETGFREYDETWSFLSLADARRIFGVRGAHWIAVRVDDVRRLDEIEDRLAAALGPGYLVDDVIRHNRSFFSALRLEKLLMFCAVGLIVLVAALGVVSTLVLTVTQKVRVIGVLTAMGATPRDILAIFVAQGLAMGLSGTFLGAALGTGLCFVLDRFQLIRLDPTIYYLDHLPFTVRPADLLAVVAASSVVAFLATLWPAWRASRLEPVEALRNE